LWAARRKPEKVVSGPSVTLLDANVGYMEIRLNPLPLRFFFNCTLVILDPYSSPLNGDNEYLTK